MNNFYALLMVLLNTTGILKHFIVSMCWWIKQWLLVCSGETGLIHAKATAILPRISFVPLVQMSVQWKKYFTVIVKEVLNVQPPWKDLRDHRGSTDHILRITILENNKESILQVELCPQV